ncbi:hypothetical protein M413DRAFT_68089, partial [Hebeloma cylindrosporum]
ALQFMSENQYVHRDVSSGNILIVDGKGKLADLEYAKAMNTGGSEGVRTVRLNVFHRLTTYHFYREPLPLWQLKLQAMGTPSFRSHRPTERSPEMPSTHKNHHFSITQSMT